MLTHQPPIHPQVFGEIGSDLPPSEEWLKLQFAPSSFPLQHRWRSNGLSADFIADYLLTFFPGEAGSPVPDKQHQSELKGAATYVANELLENAMKFNDRDSWHPITLTLKLYPDRVVFTASNALRSTQIKPFQLLIHQLLTEDPQELYFQKLEGNALDPEGSQSGVGLLTMINDYGAKIGWIFEESNADAKLTTVTTIVQIEA